MRHLVTLVAVGVVFASLAGSVRAQSFLDRLESVLRTPAAAQPAEDADAQPAEDAEAKPVEEAAPGYLGMTADETEGTGVVVVRVRANSPAAQAGLAPGDVVVTVGGQVISNLDDLAAALAGKTVGTQVEIQVLRRGDRRVFEATLSERQAESSEPPPPPQPDPLPAPDDNGRDTVREYAAPRAAGTRPALGVTVVDPTDALRRQYGVTVNRGALVTAVKEGSPAQRAGIPVGAVVVAADDTRIDGYEDLVRYLAGRSVDDSVELTYYVGNQMTRRLVRLDNVAAAGPPVEAQRRFRLFGDDSRPAAEGERPAIRALGRVLEGLAAPDDVPGVAPSVADVHELRRQVQLMQAQIDRLQDRMGELEEQLDALRPPADDE